MKVRFITLGIALIILVSPVIAQHNVTTGLPYHQINAHGMDANVQPALDILNSHSSLNNEDQSYKERYLTRFGLAKDQGTYPTSGDAEMDTLLTYFRDYWRSSMLDPSANYMKQLGAKVTPFLLRHYSGFTATHDRDRLGHFLAEYIRSRGFHTTETVNPTGRLIDMLVWKNQVDSSFHVKLSNNEEMEVQVVMMDDFVTLGWMEYATMGRHHPGGWTTDDALFCVAKSYDFESESFLVSYLAHEARHFSDKQVFKNLSSKDLEYRAKLTELSLAETTTYQLIRFFIQNANEKSENGHQQANHQLIADLSDAVFGSFEANIDLWQQVKVRKINKTAAKLLKKHTALLNERL